MSDICYENAQKLSSLYTHRNNQSNSCCIVNLFFCDRKNIEVIQTLNVKNINNSKRFI